jgi:putative membrane protein
MIATSAADTRDGTDPDPRFTLANERTFLAWNRTALALVGGGLGAGHLLDFQSEILRLAAALPPVFLGALIALASHRRWRANQLALRHGVHLPANRPPRLLAAGIGVVAVIAAVVVVADGL